MRPPSFWAATLLSTASVTIQSSPLKKNIIIDTDLFSDADDTGALLLACTHPSSNLLAVNLNYPSTYSALAASSILGYYNHSHVPLGLSRPYNDDTFFDDYLYKRGEFTSKVAWRWREYSSLPWMDVNAGTMEPVEVYRKVLAGVGDGSVTITSVGFLQNLDALLSSPPDQYSPLTGRELITAKVAELAVMGGEYPSGHEFNFVGYTPEATARVVRDWPGRVTFLGFEVGRDVHSAKELMAEGPRGDPVRAAYIWYNAQDTIRESWDPLTVLYAIEGLGDTFTLGNRGGRNVVYPDGSNVWLEGYNVGYENEGNHNYLKLAVSNQTAARILDNWFMYGARLAARDS